MSRGLGDVYKRQEKYKAGKDDADISNIRTAVECPYCHSTNTKKISTANRMV